MYSVYILHRLVSLVFLILVPLPFLAFDRSRKSKLLEGARFWKGTILAANISLVAVLASGLMIYPQFQVGKTWLILFLAVALGGALGVMSGGMKKYLLGNFVGSRTHQLKMVSYAGFAYLAVLSVIFALMGHWYVL